MRAVVLAADGRPELVELPPPLAGDGERVVEVEAAGLNPIDLATARPGAVLGREGVGILAGRRVYFGSAIAPHGTLAEAALVAADRLVAVPDAVDDGLAIALGVAGQAAWLGLEWRAGLRPGEHVLVLGASGTLGEIAVQAARLLGAGRVVAAARSQESLEHARAIGADAVVRLGEGSQAELAAEFAAAAEGRVDVIVDPLWGLPAAAALDAASAGARLVQIGSSAQREIAFDPKGLRGRLVTIQSFSSSSVPLDVRIPAYERALGFAAKGELTARVRELPLEAAAEAWEMQRESPHAKLVLRVG